MFNVGGGELLVIMLVALIVLGPAKLPEVARQVGSVAKELRRMSTNFQAEMKAALDDPTEAAARDRGNKAANKPGNMTAGKVVSTEIAPGPDPERTDSDGDKHGEVEQPEVSTAEAAGMYSIAAESDHDTGPSAPSDSDTGLTPPSEPDTGLTPPSEPDPGTST